MKLINVAVFVGDCREHTKVDAVVSDTELVIKVRHKKNVVLDTFQIVNVVKAGEAWDAIVRDEGMQRVVIQSGCGCTGMRPYEPDEGYVDPWTAIPER